MRDECLECFKKLWPPKCLKAVRNVYWGLIRVPPWLLSSLQHIQISSQQALDEILSYWAGKNKYLQSFISFILDFILTYSETWHNMGYGTLCNAKQHNHHVSYYWKYGYFCQLEAEQKLCKTEILCSLVVYVNRYYLRMLKTSMHFVVNSLLFSPAFIF